VNISQAQVSEYLDVIEESLNVASTERSKKIDELSSIDQMEVSTIVSRFHEASNQAAYLEALAMALVRCNRSQNVNLSIV